MGLAIIKHEYLRIELGITDKFTLVSKGFTSMYKTPEFAYGRNEQVLEELGLELAYAETVDAFNTLHKNSTPTEATCLINTMNLLKERPSRGKIKVFKHLKERFWDRIDTGLIIVRRDEAVSAGFDKIYTGKLLESLGLAYVTQTEYDSIFPPTLVEKVFTGKVSRTIGGVELEEINIIHFPEDACRNCFSIKDMADTGTLTINIQDYIDFLEFIKQKNHPKTAGTKIGESIKTAVEKSRGSLCPVHYKYN